MARSSGAYVRGSTVKFYEWLKSSSRHVPQGPPVWICGDCHLGNLGPIANSKEHVEIAIRDLDQTVIGNPAHDLIRLGLSLATAVRGSDLPGITTANVLAYLLSGYEETLAHRGHVDNDFHQLTGPLKLIMKRAIHRKKGQLAREQIEDDTPSIPLGKHFWPLSHEEKREVERFFATPEACKIATCLRGRKSNDTVHVLDAAYWVKGCSSLGRLRYAVLLGVGRRGDRGLCLMDIKEAAKPAAPHKPHAFMPRNPAQRVVEGARNLSPCLGERMMAGKFLGKPVFMRELLPADLKIEIEHFSCEEATAVARSSGCSAWRGSRPADEQCHPQEMGRHAQGKALEKTRGSVMVMA